jgi:putative ABC transport system permease protein
MGLWRQLTRGFQVLTRRSAADAELSDELRDYIDRSTSAHQERGLSPEAARHAARLEAGSITSIHDQVRAGTWESFLAIGWQDLRTALRMLSKSPGFAVIAILTLALGIGANTAVFSVVSAVLLAPLPYHDADKLVMVWATNNEKGLKISPVSGGVYNEWKNDNSVFEDIAPSSDTVYTLTGSGDPQFLIGYQFSAEYFRMMGVKPELGRTFTDDEDRDGGPNIVVLSDALWRRTFHADPNIVGKSIALDSKPFTVVGVMPPSYRYPQQTELWTPLGLPSSFLTNYDVDGFRILARLKPGVSLAQARAQMNAIESRIAKDHPATDAGNTVTLTPLREEISGDVRLPLLVLLGAVGLVLLVACANVANLTLARITGRQREIAVRTALGATRSRLILQFLTESLLLSVIGGTIGLVLAFFATDFLLAIFPKNISNLSVPLIDSIPIDARVFAFTFAVVALAGILFGLFPILHAVGRDISESMHGASRSVTSTLRERRFRSALVVAEIALALILVVGSGLLIESFRNLVRGDLGFNPNNVLAAEVFLPRDKYPSENPPKRLAFLNQAMDKMRAIPGVDSVGAINYLPLSGFWNSVSFTLPDQPAPAPGHEPSSDSRIVTPEYFRTMSIPILKGRNFTDADRDGTPHVIIVSEKLAHDLWGASDPVSRQLNLGDANKPDLWTVVGVAGNVSSFGLEEQLHADLYQPMAQLPFPLISFVVHSRVPPSSLVHSVQQAIWSLDKDQPIFKIIGMDQLANETLSIRRVSTILLGAFSAVAFLLAVIGIYGVMAFSVVQRTHELGVRMALGADPKALVGLVVRQGMSIALAGVALGLAGAFALTRVLASLLYNVRPTDATTFAAVTIALCLAALLACAIPARRASQVDPLAALHHE